MKLPPLFVIVVSVQMTIVCCFADLSDEDKASLIKAYQTRSLGDVRALSADDRRFLKTYVPYLTKGNWMKTCCFGLVMKRLHRDG